MNKTFCVSKCALISRIRRRVTKDAESFHINRRNFAYSDTLPDYYLTNSNNFICGPHITSLEEYGRDLGVLAPHETYKGD